MKLLTLKDINGFYKKQNLIYAKKYETYYVTMTHYGIEDEFYITTIMNNIFLIPSHDRRKSVLERILNVKYRYRF